MGNCRFSKDLMASALCHEMSDRQDLWPLTGLDVQRMTQQYARIGAQLQSTLNVIQAHTWYTNPSGALIFVNQRCADYLGLPKDHPLRFGVDTGRAWDSHIPLLDPADHDETRRVWSTCLRTGCAGEGSFRVRNSEGRYRWFLSRAEPVRAFDRTLLYWIGVNLDVEERKQAELYLAEGERLAHMGTWAFNAGFNYWSPELFRIHGLDPSSKAPTIHEYLNLVYPKIEGSSNNQFRRCWRTIVASISRKGLCGQMERFVPYAWWGFRRLTGRLSSGSLEPESMSLNKNILWNADAARS